MPFKTKSKPTGTITAPLSQGEVKKNWSRSRGMVSFLFVLVILAAGLVTFFASERNLLGWQFLAVQSGSMAPTFSTGSVVAIRQQSEYQAGEVVTYQDPENSNRLITHRIVAVETTEQGAQYRLQGDANAAADLEPIPLTAIQGKVMLAIPRLGYIIGFLQSPLGVVFFIVIPGTILLYEEIKSLWKNIHQFRQPRITPLLVVLIGVLMLLPGHTWAVYTGQAKIDDLRFVTTRWLHPEMEVEREEEKLRISTSQVGGIDEIEYRITYEHKTHGPKVKETIQGIAEKDLSEENFDLPEFTLGTCSSDEVCVPHTDISKLKIKLIFRSEGKVVHEILE